MHHRWTITGIIKLIWKTRTTFGQVRSHKQLTSHVYFSTRFSTRMRIRRKIRQQNLKAWAEQKTKKKTQTGRQKLPSHDEHTRRLTNWNKQLCAGTFSLTNFSPADSWQQRHDRLIGMRTKRGEHLWLEARTWFSFAPRCMVSWWGWYWVWPSCDQQAWAC